MVIEIYSKDNCAYCTRAKNMLTSMGYSYTEYKIGSEISREEFLEKFPNARTVPQIIINEKLIGGYEDLVQWKEETSGGHGDSFV